MKRSIKRAVLQWVSAGVVFCGALGGLRAEQFTSTSAADFQADLTAAATNDTDDVITLPAGTFSTEGNGDTRFEYTSAKNNSLEIRGAGDGLTFLTTNPNSPTNVIQIDVGGAGVEADVKISGIAFQEGEDQGLAVFVNGSDLEVTDCDFVGNNFGLVFSSVTGSVSVTDSSFRDNERGGSIQFNGVAGVATFSNNVFRGNQQGLNTTQGLEIDIFENSFIENVGTFSGTALLSSGPGNTLVKLTSNRFLRNTNNGPGGAVFLPGGPSVEVVGNLFSGNRSLFADGGALWAAGGGFALFTNNTFSGNSANLRGDAIFVGNPSISFYNNIVFGNFLGVPGNGEDIHIDDDNGVANGSPVILSHNNIGKFVSECRDNPACTENIVETENISEDPLFVNPGIDDFQLLAGSPCIAAGDPAAQNLPAQDLEGNPLNNPPDMGALAAVVTDIAVDRAAIDFGEIALEVPNTQSLTITNNGAAVLNVTGVALSDTANFAFGPGDCGGSTFSLASAESCTAEITFMPTSEAPFNATLSLSSNDPDESSLVLTLSGVGVQADTGGGGGGGGSGGGGGCAMNLTSNALSAAGWILVLFSFAGPIVLRRVRT